MTHLLDQDQIVTILSTYGYWAIFLVVALESSGLPLPGETMLVGAAIYARLSGNLTIEHIVLAAAAGAIIGDNIGYWIGREYGTKFLQRYGRYVGVGPEKLRLGQYLFYRWGGSIVFFGRFISLLRILAAVLAGANRLDPMRFIFFNAAGGAVWALVFGYGGYYLTAGFERVQGPIGTIAGLCVIVGVFLLWRSYKIHETRLIKEADAVLSQRSRP
jgi:membrane protein DedA with SNARE-associated domain